MTRPPPSASGAVSWIVVNTQTHKERFAVENLKARQFVGYCPMLLKAVRHARRTELALRPMFPAHVLAGLNTSSQPLQPILSTPGVSTVMSGRKLLQLLPAGFVAALRASEIDGKVVAPSRPDGNAQQPFGSSEGYAALIATMVGMGEDERLKVLFSLLEPARPVGGK